MNGAPYLTSEYCFDHIFVVSDSSEVTVVYRYRGDHVGPRVENTSTKLSENLFYIYSRKDFKRCFFARKSK